jgi:hypothetical protein
MLWRPKTLSVLDGAEPTNPPTHPQTYTVYVYMNAYIYIHASIYVYTHIYMYECILHVHDVYEICIYYL